MYVGIGVLLHSYLSTAAPAFSQTNTFIVLQFVYGLHGSYDTYSTVLHKQLAKGAVINLRGHVVSDVG